MILEKYELSSTDSALKMWVASADYGHQPTIDHKHTNFEISTVLSGSAVYRCNDREYKMEIGDVFVFSSNEYHCIKDVGTYGIKILNLQFKPIYLLEKNYDSISKRNSNLCFVHSPDFENRIESKKAENIRESLFAIKDELKSRNIEFKLAVKSYVNRIMIELFRKHAYLDNQSLPNKPHIKEMKESLYYIDKHFNEKILLADLARLSNMSENHFSFVFKSVFNISPSEYIITKRLELAVQILASDENINMLDLALKCGFNNTANFNKIFKKHIGVTPSEYRLQSKTMLVH